MTRIKICGLKREQDIEYANRHLPDYVGFVFAASKRRVDVSRARILSLMLDNKIKRAGIFVNQSTDEVAQAAIQCGLDVIQIHGDEPPVYFKELRQRLKCLGCENRNIAVWKAIRVKGADCLKQMPLYDADAFVLDSFAEGSYGGAGKTFDWGLAAEAKKYGDIVLAGGLTESNVQNAISVVNPFAVDISSGVETDGGKDEDKIKRFIYSVRSSSY
ncbi:phosphoribosylanthranilate isomerase [Anaerobacterium chartisolvens]|nr:phosphoribosylanthranilate isomerase [Anaerobacterium chartisolvens]